MWNENAVTAILMVGLSVTVYLAYQCIDSNNDAERYWTRSYPPVAHVIRACRYILYMVVAFGVQLIVVQAIAMLSS